MKDLEKTTPDGQDDTPDTSAAFLTQPTNELNQTDPVPALGGATRDEARLRASGPITFEKLDDDLYAAIQAGDEVHVRARLGSSDKPLTEAEAIILIRTREKEEERAYERMLEAMDADDGDDDNDDLVTGMFFNEPTHHASHAALLGVDAYGGRYDRKKARYHDRFGGTYDITGYRAPDGSYTTAAGDHFVASAGAVRLAIGGPDALVPENLILFGEDIMKVALQIAEIRDAARGERLAVLGADAAAGGPEVAAQIINTIAYAAPRAMAAMPVHAAAESDDAFIDACKARADAARERFEKIVSDDNFKAAAAAAPGGAAGYLDSCPALTRKDLAMAAEILGDNLHNGRTPAQMMRYHYKNILEMADDAEDKLACELRPKLDQLQQFNRAALPSLSSDANAAFEKAAGKLATVGFNLKDKADAVFAKKPDDATPVVPAVIAAGMQKYRNALRRTGAALNMA